jgi:hypothetical protein
VTSRRFAGHQGASHKEQEAAHHVAIETDDQAENCDDAAEEFHQRIVPLRDAEPGRADGLSPALFFKKLAERLKSVGIKYGLLDYKTDQQDPPPCYAENGVSYTEWLKFASASTLPIRMDMPGEPNYCHDCTPEFKIKAMKAGNCLFPNTRFEHRKELDEKSTVGVSRSPNVPPEAYVIYQEMTVPLDALRDKLRKYAEEHVMGLEIPKFNVFDIPPDERPDVTTIMWNRGRTEE